MSGVKTTERKPGNIIFGKRLAYLIELKGISKTDFAKSIGYAQSSMISQICSGDKAMSQEKIMKASEILDFPPKILTSEKEIPFEILEAIMALMKLPKDHYFVEGLRDLLKRNS